MACIPWGCTESDTTVRTRIGHQLTLGTSGRCPALINSGNTLTLSHFMSVLVRAAITQYHRLDCLNNRNLFSNTSESWKSKIKVLTWLLLFLFLFYFEGFFSLLIYGCLLLNFIVSLFCVWVPLMPFHLYEFPFLKRA